MPRAPLGPKPIRSAALSNRSQCVICDPNLLSDSELEKLTRRYTAELMDFLGPERDVPTRWTSSLRP